MKFVMNHAPDAESLSRPFNQQSSALPLCYVHSLNELLKLEQRLSDTANLYSRLAILCKEKFSSTDIGQNRHVGYFIVCPHGMNLNVHSNV